MPKIIDLVGKVFGELTVLSQAEYSSHVRPKLQWRCLCSCGNECVVLGESLRGHHTKSCGCKSGKYSHGHCKTVNGNKDSPTYSTWRAMRNRCLNLKHNAFNRYGAKGVSICQSWIDSFETFLFDMGERPFGMTLDRIDNTKGYSKSNCRWATSKQQYENKRVVRNSLGKFSN